MIAVGGEDYEELSRSNFSVQLNFTDDYRNRCFNMIITNDDISEQIESFTVKLEADLGSLSKSSIELLPGTATINILDDDCKHFWKPRNAISLDSATCIP